MFTIPNRFRLLVQGVHVYKMTPILFFTTSCVVFLNENGDNSNCQLPTFGDYIPLDEILMARPSIDDAILSKVYRYY